jgi:hypothetical protein
MFTRVSRAVFVLCLVATAWQVSKTALAHDSEGRWKRSISYQDKNDLFANYQVGPNPSGTAAPMYVSPQPVPAHVGHTYTTYQPLMPHEYLYKHTRSHYAYAPGCGWTRSKVRYRTHGLRLQDMMHNLSGGF